ncbi:MAG: response regulator transcription factor [Marmoricola sp.]
MNSHLPLRVAIVNDYEVVVLGLARMLGRYPDRVAVIEIDANEPPTADVDIALYDTFAATGHDELDIGSVLIGSNARLLVVYSWNLAPGLVGSALARGANGYLGKRLAAAELVDALERINAGETVVTEEIAEPAPDPGDWPGREEGLTERESEIVALITQGLSNQEIADRASLSINTVKSYIRSSYRKMAVTSRSQAVLWGVAHGFRPDHTRIQVPVDEL